MYFLKKHSCNPCVEKPSYNDISKKCSFEFLKSRNDILKNLMKVKILKHNYDKRENYFGILNSW